jgi:hypothetical protein
MKYEAFRALSNDEVAMKTSNVSLLTERLLGDSSQEERPLLRFLKGTKHGKASLVRKWMKMLQEKMRERKMLKAEAEKEYAKGNKRKKKLMKKKAKIAKLNREINVLMEEEDAGDEFLIENNKEQKKVTETADGIAKTIESAEKIESDPSILFLVNATEAELREKTNLQDSNAVAAISDEKFFVISSLVASK